MPCKSDQIVNPATGRCVQKSGKIGRALLSKPKEFCKSDQIVNPATGRCVQKSGKIGRALLSKSKEPCKFDQIVDPATGRCVKKSGKSGRALLEKSKNAAQAHTNAQVPNDILEHIGKFANTATVAQMRTANKFLRDMPRSKAEVIEFIRGNLSNPKNKGNLVKVIKDAHVTFGELCRLLEKQFLVSKNAKVNKEFIKDLIAASFSHDDATTDDITWLPGTTRWCSVLDSLLYKLFKKFPASKVAPPGVVLSKTEWNDTYHAHGAWNAYYYAHDKLPKFYALIIDKYYNSLPVANMSKYSNIPYSKSGKHIVYQDRVYPSSFIDSMYTNHVWKQDVVDGLGEASMRNEIKEAIKVGKWNLKTLARGA